MNAALLKKWFQTLAPMGARSKEASPGRPTRPKRIYMFRATADIARRIGLSVAAEDCGKYVHLVWRREEQCHLITNTWTRFPAAGVSTA